jgi:hypothetical protein
MEVDAARFEFSILGHPVMHPGPSFIEMVCFSSIYLPSQPFPACPVLSSKIMQPGFTTRTSNAPLPEDAVMRAANHAIAKVAKKKKDDESERKAEKEKAKLDWMKWRQGSEGEENKEEERDDEEEDAEEEEDDGVEWDVS